MLIARSWLVRLGSFTLPLLLPALVAAAEPRTARQKVGQFNASHETVEMFQAMSEGTIDVKFIPVDDKGATVLIENKSNKPLNVRLPEAFAGVPVLAQFGQGGGGGGFGGGGGGGGGQGMGGGMGGGGGAFGGGGGGGMQGGGGFFNVAPEQVGQIKVACLCLDHGKLDPTPRMKYEIKPIESYVSRREVIELVKLFSQGSMDHGSAQAAVWHLNNDLSWQELASKSSGRKRLVGGEAPYFSPQQIQLGFHIALVASRAARVNAPPESSSKSSDSLQRP